MNPVRPFQCFSDDDKLQNSFDQRYHTLLNGLNLVPSKPKSAGTEHASVMELAQSKSAIFAITLSPFVNFDSEDSNATPERSNPCMQRSGGRTLGEENVSV